MKFGPVTKLDKRNKKTSKKIENDVILTNCDVIVIFLIYGQFGKQSRSWILDAQSVKLTFSLIAIFYLIKTENRTKKSNTALTLLL